MDRAAVSAEDISELTRRLAEAAGQARVLEAKLAGIDGPLATLAALRMEAIADELDTMLEGLADSSSVLRTVVAP